LRLTWRMVPHQPTWLLCPKGCFVLAKAPEAGTGRMGFDACNPPWYAFSKPIRFTNSSNSDSQSFNVTTCGTFVANIKTGDVRLYQLVTEFRSMCCQSQRLNCVAWEMFAATIASPVELSGTQNSSCPMRRTPGMAARRPLWIRFCGNRGIDKLLQVGRNILTWNPGGWGTGNAPREHEKGSGG
jgi:hypothetical protein